MAARPSAGPLPSRPINAKYQEAFLDNALLRDNRVIAHDVTNPLSRSFDMLRTQKCYS